jgi:LPXTG-motif cell wall-anchored protein
MTRLLGAITLALSLTMLVALSVAAHAQLESSDPADGETITTPYTLTATFTEPFDPQRSFVRVQDASGAVVAEGGVSDDDPRTMIVELPELPAGEYRARWQTVTPDDNGRENGTFTFNVAAAATPAPTQTPRPTLVTQKPATSASPTPAATPTPIATPPASPSPTDTPPPTEPDGSQTGLSANVLIALLVGVAIVGALAFFLVRRSRLP